MVSPTGAESLPRMLRRVAAGLSGEIDLGRLLPQIVSAARAVTGAQYTALGVLDAERNHIVRFIHEGMDPEIVDRIGSYPTGGGLLGELIRHPEPILVADLREHPAFRGFPPHHPPMGNFLGVPIQAAGGVFGNLYLTDKQGGFDEDDLNAISILGSLAGIAVHAAQLAQSLREVAVQHERERISRDLHDGVIQSLFSVGMGLEGAKALLARDPSRVEERIDAAVDQLDATIREIRNTIFTLRPGSADLGLEAGLLELAREYEVNAILRPTVNLRTSLDPHVPDALVPDVLHIVREALSNVAKHAAAPNVKLEAAVQEGELQIDVRDTGSGFDPETVRAGHGLGNMAERAVLLGGRLSIESIPGEGTHVTVVVPVEEPHG